MKKNTVLELTKIHRRFNCNIPTMIVLPLPNFQSLITANTNVEILLVPN